MAEPLDLERDLTHLARAVDAGSSPITAREVARRARHATGARRGARSRALMVAGALMIVVALIAGVALVVTREGSSDRTVVTPSASAPPTILALKPNASGRSDLVVLSTATGAVVDAGVRERTLHVIDRKHLIALSLLAKGGKCFPDG